MWKYMGFWEHAMIENRSTCTTEDESLMLKTNWKALGMVHKNKLRDYIDYWKHKTTENTELNTKTPKSLKNIWKIFEKLYQRKLMKYMVHWKCNSKVNSNPAVKEDHRLLNIWKTLGKIYQITLTKYVSRWKYEIKARKELARRKTNLTLTNMWKISGKLYQMKLMNYISHWKEITYENSELLIKKKKLKELCQFLENDLQFIRFRSNFDSEIPVVSMNKLFHVIINLFKEQQQEDANKIRELIHDLSFPLSPGDFARTILLNIDPSLTQNQLKMIYENAKVASFEGITAEVFVNLVTKFAICRTGIDSFNIQDLFQNKEVNEDLDGSEGNEEDSDEFIDQIDEGVTNIKLIPNSPRKRKNVK